MTGPEIPERAPATQPEQSVRSALAALWQRSKGPLGEQVSVLEAAAMSCLSGELGAAQREQARSEAHKLLGSLGTFGMPEGSDIARSIETWFEFPGSVPSTEPAAVLALSDAVVALRRCLEAGPAPGVVTAWAPLAGDAPFLLLVDDDVVLAEGLRQEASARRLGLCVVTTVGEARQILANRRPEALLLEVPAGSGAEEAFKLMRELHAATPPVPVVVLTRAARFTDRVEAARLGGRGFLQKPIQPRDALDCVAAILDRARSGETILVVDDDPAVLAALGAIVETGGRRVVALREPLRFWETLAETSPDLVVLDVEMPDVNGVELCQVVRADPRWERLPVLFLTARVDAGTVQSIFAAGADDYVAKPVLGPELATRISNRLERSRLLRRLAEVDSLTGLANRRTAEESLGRLLGMAKLSGQPVAVAMVEPDRVEAIDDERGYQAGDEALGRLGQLLLRFFLGDDVAGRWGGAELCVGMHGMTRGDGVQRLAEVLEELRRHRFPDGRGGTLGASFSAGVAQYPDDGNDLRSLCHVASRALGRAREAGGDRILPATRSTHHPERATADVVLAEDDEALAGILLHALTTRGYRTRWFDDGQDAATALQGPDPEISSRAVLLDWGLPGLDGLRVLRRLAETGVLAHTRVIMLTARDSESEVLQALDLGAFDHVAKPFSVPVLIKRLHRALES